MGARSVLAAKWADAWLAGCGGWAGGCGGAGRAVNPSLGARQRNPAADGSRANTGVHFVD